MLNGICPKCKAPVKRKIRDREETIKSIGLIRIWREYTCSVCRHVWFAEHTANGWLKGTPPEGLFDE